MRALPGGFVNARQSLLHIFLRVGAATHLNQRDIQFALCLSCCFHNAAIITASCPASTGWATLRAAFAHGREKLLHIIPESSNEKARPPIAEDSSCSKACA